MSGFTAFIFARGGSKGVPHKNIFPVAEKPLIAHSIESALASQSVSRVVVSTDDEQIAKATQAYGAEVLHRPSELAGDTTAEVLAWRHAIENLPELFRNNAQPFISLPATSPLRAPVDIDNAIARYKKSDCDMVFGITPSHRNPHLNMVTIDANGHIHIAIGGSDAVRRQDVPDMYDVTTCVYVGSPDYIRGCKKLMEGRVGYVIIPAERALDIDNYFDLHLAELMIKHPYIEPKKVRTA
ncbi:MAG: NTP transferase domain-containing protein [Alphaproteobacteria bacterium]